MRWQAVCLKSGHALQRLVDEPEPFGHQRGVKPEEGRHAGVDVNRHPAGFEKGGNAGIALTGRNEAPATDHAGHGKRLTVFGDPVGKNNARRPVGVAKRQRGGRLSAKRHHDIQPFKLAAKSRCLFDVAVIILCQKRLPQQRDIAGIILKRAQEEIRRLPDIVEIERLPRRQIVARGRHSVVRGANHRRLVRVVLGTGSRAAGLRHVARDRRGGLLCQGDGSLRVAPATGQRKQDKCGADRQSGRPVISSSMKRGEHDPSLPAYRSSGPYIFG